MTDELKNVLKDLIDSILLDLWYADWHKGSASIYSKSRDIYMNFSQNFQDAAISKCGALRSIRYFSCYSGPQEFYVYRSVAIPVAIGLKRLLQDRENHFQHPQDAQETSCYEI